MSNLRNKIYILLILFFVLIPVLFKRLDILSIITLALIYIILALGLNVIIGFCGLLALGFAAFYGIGAYTTALIYPYFGLPILIFFVILTSALSGLICGAPVLRLRGDYLAIVTLGFGEIVRIVFNNWDKVTNGPRGISNISVKKFIGINFSHQVPLYYLALFFVVTLIIFLKRIDGSKIGREWIAIREDEIAASSLGINTVKLKLFAFLLGSICAGLAGFLFASWQAFVSPESFTFNESTLVICMIVIGGIGSIPGVIIGAILLAVLPEILRMFLNGFEIYRMLFFGVILIIMMLFRPQGIFYNKRRSAELVPEYEKIKEEEDVSLYDERRK